MYSVVSCNKCTVYTYRCVYKKFVHSKMLDIPRLKLNKINFKVRVSNFNFRYVFFTIQTCWSQFLCMHTVRIPRPVSHTYYWPWASSFIFSRSCEKFMPLFERLLHTLVQKILSTAATLLRLCA